MTSLRKGARLTKGTAETLNPRYKSNAETEMRFTRNAVLILNCALSVLFGKALIAQTPSTQLHMHVGARVRVSSPTLGSFGPAWVGTVLAQHGDTLSLQHEGTQDTLALSLGSISKLEESAGTHSHVGKGMGLGFLTGASLGSVLGATSYTPGSCDFLCGRGVAAGAGGLAGALLGTILGGFIGVVHTEDWERVTVRVGRVGIRIAPSGNAGFMVPATF